MWFINANTLKLKDFPDERNLRYAILSHRWEGKEVSFKDHPLSKCKDKAKAESVAKIKNCCEQARKHGLEWVWIDTCCIDKGSSAELQEAINSMFRWYSKATVCYAYLSDSRATALSTDDSSHFSRSKWFTRGWTLQELVAPSNIIFMDMDWESFGTRYGMSESLAQITGIDSSILKHGFPKYESGARPPVCNIMSWARGRTTTRREDRAYSLMGLFDVNMPMLYGEGDKAFLRLQEEIIRNTDDQTIFAWERLSPVANGCFAASPDQFEKLINPSPPTEFFLEARLSHSVTNRGITMDVELIPWRPYIYLAVFNAVFALPEKRHLFRKCGIFLVPTTTPDCFVRATGRFDRLWTGDLPKQGPTKEIILVRRISQQDRVALSNEMSPQYGFRFLFNQTLWSDIKYVRPGQFGVYKDELHQDTDPELARARMQLGGRSFQICLSDKSGLVATLRLRSPVRKYQELKIELAFLRNFNPHCFIHFPNTAFAGVQEKFSHTSDDLDLASPKAYSQIFVVDKPDFTAYSKRLNWSRSMFMVDHRWEVGRGEILSGYNYLCLRGEESNVCIPTLQRYAVRARVVIGTSEGCIELEIEIKNPDVFEKGSTWECNIFKVS